MKQVLYDKSGNVFVEDVAAPSCGENEIIVKNKYSLLSSGTEKSMIDLMRKPLYKMALDRMDLTKQVLNFAKESGIKKTIDLVKSRLDVWHLLGYSSCGTVVKVGANIENVGIGDIVACLGSSVANHAEYIAVPKNMFTKVPKGVLPNEAACAGVGSIAMQSIRQLNPTLGETHVVIGLGLIGQMVAQLLKANGCKVIGIDPDKNKLKNNYIDIGYASSDIKGVLKYTNSYGADGVIIGASTSANLVNDAFDMCRRRGRVILLGVCNLNIDRSKMYEKELSFKISTAFGPGYYDPNYEQKNIDYPIGYVRWTLNRNMDAFMDLIKEKKLDIKSLIDSEFPVEKANEAYKNIFEKSGLGVLIKYNPEKDYESDSIIEVNPNIQDIISEKRKTINIGLIGAGNFTKGFLIPEIKKIPDFKIFGVATKNGSTSKKIAKELSAKYATTDYKTILKDKNIDLIIIGTRHDSHAKIAIEAVSHGKHIYVEKPAAIKETEFAKLKTALADHKQIYVVGFNRRYSVCFTKIKKLLSKDKPMIINYIFNNSFLPEDHWVNQKDVGGGRIIGEACHIIDLFNYLTQSTPRKIFSEKLTSTKGEINDDNNIITTIKYQDGSLCNLIYACSGSNKTEREKCTIIQDGNVIEMNNFSTVTQNGNKILSSKADLGYETEMIELRNAIRSKDNSLITKKESILATEITFKIVKLIKGL